LQAADLSRWFLAAFFSGVALFYTTAILRKKRRLGRSPVTPGEKGTRHRLIHNVFVVFRATILLVCLIRVPFPQIDAWLFPLLWFWHPAAIVSGCALMLASFIAIIWLHNSMGADWRSGIEEHADDRGQLIESGAFAWTRNPIFIGIQLAQLGFFLALPTVFTLVCLIIGVAAIHAQVRLEERHLEARFGDVWRSYAARVPRWIIR
jgi:protein-S-isoprenylcysteine O-methyltransferase Ste14